MRVRVTVRTLDLVPGEQVDVDPRNKRVKRLLDAKVLVPVKSKPDES